MGNQNTLAFFIRTQVRVAWISTGLSTILFFLMLVNGNLQHWGNAISHIIRMSVQASDVLIGLLFFLMAAVVNTIITIIISFQGTREMRAKLSMVAEASSLYAAGKLTYRMNVTDHDDLSMIAQNLNVMAERLHDQVSVLQEAARQNAELQKSVEAAAVLRERERVRRELHDRVSQELFGLSMLSSTAAKIRGSKPDKALELLPEIDELAKHAQGAMRALLLELRPLELNQRQLVPALKDLAGEMAERTGINIDFHYFVGDGVKVEINSAIEDSLFLIAQEAMINAIKHAEPCHISLELNIETSRLVLRVTDDGKGFALEEGKLTSVGLRSMKERAEHLGGTVAVKSDKGNGTEIMCIIPRIE